MKQKFFDIFIYLLFIGSIFFTFIILDVSLRFQLWETVRFVSFTSISPLAFSCSYILFILLLLIILPKKFNFFYVIFTILANIYFLCQLVHFKILDNLFSFVSLFSAEEGADYFDYAFKTIDFKMIVTILLSLASMIFVIIINKKFKPFNSPIKLKTKLVYLFICLFLFVCFRCIGIYKLGKSVPQNSWDAWNVPKNVHKNFNNKNRSMMVSGLYEYPIRDIYLYIKKLVNPNTKEKIKDIDNYIDNLNIALEENKYTGIFKDKNLIMIMMESIDESQANEIVMPTLTYLSKTGLSFENRYAPFFGAAMTINSEFSSVTGIYSVTEEKAIYNYNDTHFTYSLPNLFKNNGYSVNSIHMNNGEFYNRTNFHKTLGFEKHYSLFNKNISTDVAFDTNLVLDDASYNLIKKSDKFMTFITTYSAHVPYIDNYMCNDLINKNNFLKVENNNELTCLRLLSNETDNFLKELLIRLDNDKILDDTILVIFSDHYAYGYSNINDLRNITDSNLIQKSPLVIWSKNIKSSKIDKMTDTADIAPTLLNMFGLEYNPKLYLGTDVFSKYHENFVYFSDYSWYDGNIYSKTATTNDYIKEISLIVSEKININEKIISSDYYKHYEENDK